MSGKLLPGWCDEPLHLSKCFLKCGPVLHPLNEESLPWKERISLPTLDRFWGCKLTFTRMNFWTSCEPKVTWHNAEKVSNGGALNSLALHTLYRMDAARRWELDGNWCANIVHSYIWDSWGGSGNDDGHLNNKAGQLCSRSPIYSIQTVWQAVIKCYVWCTQCAGHQNHETSHCVCRRVGCGNKRITKVFESTVPLAPAKGPAPTLKCIFQKRASGAFPHLLLAEYFARHWLKCFSPLWRQAVPGRIMALEVAGLDFTDSNKSLNCCWGKIRCDWSGLVVCVALWGENI